MTKTDKAIEYFRGNFNCAQSVFTVFGTEYGLSEDHCLKIASPFGAGMGRQQLTCGAVTGALMALGLKFGKGSGDSDDKKKESYMITRDFFNEFSRIHGSCSCKKLLNNLDINDPDDHRKIVELGLFETACEKYVSDAVKITEKLLEKY